MLFVLLAQRYAKKALSPKFLDPVGPVANCALQAASAQQHYLRAEKIESSVVDTFQIRDEDLASAGNQEKAADLALEDQIEDAEQEQEVEEQIEHGLEAESREVCICSYYPACPVVQELSMQY